MKSDVKGINEMNETYADPFLAQSNPSTPLPELYDMELSLHNRYPLCILRVNAVSLHSLQKDKEMKSLIESLHPHTMYDKRAGWIKSDDLTQIRGLLKKQAMILLDRFGFDTDAVG